jgi:hypothetical protein
MSACSPDDQMLWAVQLVAQERPNGSLVVKIRRQYLYVKPWRRSASGARVATPHLGRTGAAG